MDKIYTLKYCFARYIYTRSQNQKSAEKLKTPPITNFNNSYTIDKDKRLRIDMAATTLRARDGWILFIGRGYNMVGAPVHEWSKGYPFRQKNTPRPFHML